MESEAPAAPATITLTMAELRELIEDIVDERLAEIDAEAHMELSPEFEAQLRRSMEEPQERLSLEEVKRQLGLD